MLDTASKVLGLLILGKKAAERPAFHRFLSSVAAVVALTVITAMLIGAMLIGLLYGGYRIVLLQGLEPVTGALVIGFITLLLTVALAMYTLQQVRRLVDMPRRLQRENDGILQRASSVVESFLDGLMTPSAHPVNDDSVRPTPYGTFFRDGMAFRRARHS